MNRVAITPFWIFGPGFYTEFRCESSRGVPTPSISVVSIILISKSESRIFLSKQTRRQRRPVGQGLTCPILVPESLWGSTGAPLGPHVLPGGSLGPPWGRCSLSARACGWPRGAHGVPGGGAPTD